MTLSNPPSDDNEGKSSATSQARQGVSTTTAEIPERPVLAANVELVGEMEGTGFKDRQWLVQRDGQFIQLTELLYRVAEQANGERTLEEMAAGVTDSTDWIISAENVRQLIQTKLMPPGLIAATEGVDAPPGGTAARARARSPLAVNMRMKAIGPRFIDPVTKVLQILYAPPILIPALVVIAIAHAWLYFVHGVGGAFLEVLYTPGLALVVLTIMFASSVIHEFGHASALQYGGGKVRGMGAGIYLIYPAFYTDVTDSYRLGRWARVRTGLGGFYFHLILALAIMGLYLISGREFLLFVVVLINLDIVRQCLPFVRLDGYWVLANLTGIPDFFSQIGPFLRSVLPIPGWEGSKLPNLKPWVKAVFAVYIVLTVPVLTFLLFLLLWNVPGILAIVWDSLLNQTADFSVAWNNGNAIGVATSASQMLILGLEILGITYLLYVLGRGLAKAIWNWSKPTLMRRVTGTLVAAGVVVAVVFLWSPNLPFTGKEAPDGVESFEVSERAHVETPVSYPQTPSGRRGPRARVAELRVLRGAYSRRERRAFYGARRCVDYLPAGSNCGTDRIGAPVGSTPGLRAS